MGVVAKFLRPRIARDCIEAPYENPSYAPDHTMKTTIYQSWDVHCGGGTCDQAETMHNVLDGNLDTQWFLLLYNYYEESFPYICET